MEILITLLIMAAVFGLCFLVDKLFTKIFRSQAQHMSGLALRPSKRYGSIGLLMAVLGIGAIFAGLGDSTLLIAGGALILVVGIGLVVYYLSTGIFYDDNSFLYTAFGKKNRTYQYNQILHQQLYIVQGGSTVIELHMTDGSAVQVQSTMAGYDAFLNTAFLGWVRQKNIDIREHGDFHDPANSRWFPSAEDL